MLDELIAAIEAAKNDHAKFKPTEMLDIVTRTRESLVRVVSAMCSNDMPAHVGTRSSTTLTRKSVTSSPTTCVVLGSGTKSLLRC